MAQFHEPAPNYALLEQHCHYAQSQLHVKLFPNYVAANFLNPNFNYDTPKFWGVTQIAEESGFRTATTPAHPGCPQDTGCVNVPPVSSPPPDTPGILRTTGESADVWPRILDDLQRRVSRAAFNTWLNPLELQETTPERWTFRVPDEVFVFWLEKNYRALLRDVISRHTGHTPELRFVVVKPQPSWSSQTLKVSKCSPEATKPSRSEKTMKVTEKTMKDVTKGGDHV
jgi:hypothetical protein